MLPATFYQAGTEGKHKSGQSMGSRNQIPARLMTSPGSCIDHTVRSSPGRPIQGQYTFGFEKIQAVRDMGLIGKFPLLFCSAKLI